MKSLNSENQSMIREQVEDLNVYKEGQPVELIIKGETDLGYKAIVDNKYWGVLYYNEVFQDLNRNQEVVGYIKKIRDDLRIDLSLYQLGSFGSEDIGNKILEELKAAGGYLNIDSKTSADDIYVLFGVSKKKFKMALGGLYKKRLVSIKEDGIYFLDQ